MRPPTTKPLIIIKRKIRNNTSRPINRTRITIITILIARADDNSCTTRWRARTWPSRRSRHLRRPTWMCRTDCCDWGSAYGVLRRRRARHDLECSQTGDNARQKPRARPWRATTRRRQRKTESRTTLVSTDGVS